MALTMMTFLKKSTWRSVAVLLILFSPDIISYSDRLFSEIDTSNLIINLKPQVPVKEDGNLTIFDLVLLNQLQNHVEDVIGLEQFRDPIWIRTDFLRNLLQSARWNVKLAKRKFKKAIHWQNKLSIDSFENEILQDFLPQAFPIEMNGYDKEGCPIIILPIGTWKTYRSYTEKLKSILRADFNFRTHFTSVMDEILERVKTKKNPACSQFTLIADLENYNFMHSSGIDAFIDTIKLFDKSYPGLLKIAYMINGSPDFLNVAAAFKNTIPWDLRRKGFIYTNRTYWEDALLETIDPSQLSPRYGGDNFFFGPL